MIVVRRLKDDQFDRLKEIFRDEFDSDVPLPQNSTIFGAFEDGKLVGFILSETVQIIGQVYVTPDKRKESVGIVKELVEKVRKTFDGKEPTAAVASEPRFGKLYQSLGMEKIDGELWRKNI